MSILPPLVCLRVLGPCEPSSLVSELWVSRCAYVLRKPGTWATQLSGEDLVKEAGSQGVELLMWLTARAAILGAAHRVTWNYHIPISNTAAGTLVLEPAA